MRASGSPIARCRRRAACHQHLGLFNSHHRLAAPVAPWERLKIGGGTPPILTRHGWLILYHGVEQLAEPDGDGRHLRYSAGVMVLSKEHPHEIRYRSPEPVVCRQNCRRTQRDRSPTSCSPPASIGATISERRIASMSIMGWPTTGSAWRVLTCQIACRRWGRSPIRRKQKYRNPIPGRCSTQIFRTMLV